jgi:hypothetical protein
MAERGRLASVLAFVTTLFTPSDSVRGWTTFASAFLGTSNAAFSAFVTDPKELLMWKQIVFCLYLLLALYLLVFALRLCCYRRQQGAGEEARTPPSPPQHLRFTRPALVEVVDSRVEPRTEHPPEISRPRPEVIQPDNQ